ncbi:lipoprotein 17-related variable surface protein [[Mycoplasma] mobile]|uniref:Expressed protein n=1 Tax=Mycoplasma mobile (strain ATCC 43663 / 163K / NCTC 11711) TaxID=267748 RepID=Q6KHD5_MYCM1|nr:lipoprotein 17-related variable surface protein [[Mycoplasma] mobile]AAT27995.1 expressed protein [Mycoplasma mobile 163K]
MKYKKMFLGLGSATMIAIPMSAVVACGATTTTTTPTTDQVLDTIEMIGEAIAKSSISDRFIATAAGKELLPTQVTASNVNTIAELPKNIILPNNKGNIVFSFGLITPGQIEHAKWFDPSFTQTDIANDTNGTLTINLYATYQGISTRLPIFISELKKTPVPPVVPPTTSSTPGTSN